MRHRILIEFAFDLPNDESSLLEAYGTTDPAECFNIDLENDPGATLLDYCDIINWEVIQDGEIRSF
jgi:hypothetical protein